MDAVCTYCAATKWKDEPPGLCCSNGNVQLLPLLPPCKPLQFLMRGYTSDSKHFLQHIRQYNSCFQMTFFGATKEIRGGGFMPTFKVQGQIYHRVVSLLPTSGADPQFLQIYFMGDAATEANHRCSRVPGTRRYCDTVAAFPSREPRVRSTLQDCT